MLKLLQPIPKFEPITCMRSKKTFRRSDIKNDRVVVFYFWSSECSRCKGWPQFVETLRKLYGNSVQCIVVHDGVFEEAITYIDGATCIIDGKEQLATDFQVRQFPAIYVFDREHRLRFYQSGVSESRLLIRRIEKFIDAS